MENTLNCRFLKIINSTGHSLEMPGLSQGHYGFPVVD